MHVDPNMKFACWYFSHAPFAKDWPDDAPIAKDAFAARRMDIKMPDHWATWLGSLAADEIKAGGLTPYTVAPSKTPKILDRENEAQKTRCNDLLNGLLIQGVPEYQRALLMTGAHVEGEVQIRQYVGGTDIVA